VTYEAIREQLEEARRLSLSHPEESLNQTRKLISLTRTQNHKDLEIFALSNLAAHYNDLNDWQKGLTYTNLTIRLAQDEHDEATVVRTYLTQAALMFRTLKLKSAITSLFEAWELMLKQPELDPVARMQLLQMTSMFLTLLGQFDIAIETETKAIPYCIQANRDLFGRTVYGRLALIAVWKMEQVGWLSEQDAQLAEYFRLGDQFPTPTTYGDSGYFYFAAQSEYYRVKEEWAQADAGYDDILGKFQYPSYRANHHQVYARSAECRFALGDTAGVVKRLNDIQEALNHPVTRMVLPQTLRIAMNLSEKLGRMDLYAFFAEPFKLSLDRVHKAKNEARVGLTRLPYFAAEIE
jgi:tetratricopeptide (TPR) repeat protein